MFYTPLFPFIAFLAGAAPSIGEFGVPHAEPFEIIRRLFSTLP
jgi:hypothetical protein